MCGAMGDSGRATLLVIAGLCIAASVAVSHAEQVLIDPGNVDQSIPPGFDCGYRSPEQWMAALRDAVRRGEIADPATKPLPAVAPRAPQPAGPSRSKVD